MTRPSTPALLLAVLVSAGCGVPAPSQGGPAVPDELTITVDDGTGGAPLRWTLTCDPLGGDHPDPAAACAALDRARAPFDPVPAGMNCTMIYGGPQTATVTGTWHGEPVQASYQRTDGCEIARWNTLAAVLGSGGSGS